MMTATRRDFLRASAAAGLALGAGPLFAADVKPARDKRTILMLGGTGFLGPQVVEYAIQRGHAVTLFNRGKTRPGLFPDLEKLQGNRDGDLKALEGRKWDAAVDTSGNVPRIVKASADLLAPNIKQYLYISSISVYADTSKPGQDETAKVMTMDDPSNEEVMKNYGALKALSEKAAEASMPGRVAVVRPGLIVGPDDPSDRFTYWPVRIERGGEVLAPGDGTDPVQVIDARDLSEWMIRLAELGTTGTYNALGPRTPRLFSELLHGIKAVTTSDATFTWVDADFLAAHQVLPYQEMPVWMPARNGRQGFGRFDISREVGLGLTFRPLAVTARDTLDYYRAQPGDRQEKLRAGISPGREAEVLAAWHNRPR